jgi:hypothetical protein
MRIRKSTVAYTANAFVFETREASTADHLRIPVHYPEDADISTGTTRGEMKTVFVVDYSEASAVGDVIYESGASTLPPPDESR